MDVAATEGSEPSGTSGPGSGPAATTYTYKAFISYSHAVDGKLAPRLQTALQRFAKPWYRLRALRVFRDETSLSANPALWSSIERALNSSEFFVLLASPDAAQSTWVSREVAHWRQRRGPATLLVVLTDGHVDWDDEAGDFDWNRSTAIPPALKGYFTQEPRHIDFTWARQEPDVALTHPRFRSRVADVAAPLHGRAKDDLVGEDVRQHRRMLRWAWSAAALLGVLTLLAVNFARVASEQRDQAQEGREVATSRQLAAQSLANTGDRLDRSLLLALAAWRTRPTVEARSALFTALQRSPHLITYLHGTTIEAHAVAFSPDRKSLAVGTDDGIDIWDVASRSSRVHLPAVGVVAALAFNREGTLLAVHNQEAIDLWDFREQRKVGRPLVHNGSVHDMEFSPDGRTLASSSAEKGVVLWDVATQARVGTSLAGHEYQSLSVAFNVEGSLIASTDGSTVVVWDARTRATAAVLDAGDGGGEAVSFSPDGKLLALGSADRSVTLWEVASRNQLGGPLVADALETAPRLPGAQYHFASIAFSPDSKTLMLGSHHGHVVFWDVETRRVRSTLEGHDGHVHGVAFSPDGAMAVSAGTDGTILWSAGQPDPRLRVASLTSTRSGDVAAVVISPDGATVAATLEPNVVTLWEVANAESEPKSLAGHTSTIRGMAFSPDGGMLASGGLSDGVLLWRVPDGTQVDKLPLRPGKSITELRFHPGGRLIGAAGRDGTVAIWDLETRSETTLVTGASAPLEAIAFSPDGTTVAAGSADGQVFLWDLRTHQQLVPPLAAHSAVESLEFSPDGRTLASGGGDHLVKLWDTRSRRQLGWDLARHSNDVGGLAFTPDGRTLISGSEDGSIVFWDVPTRQPLSDPLVVSERMVGGVDVSNTSRVAATGTGPLNREGVRMTVEVLDADIARWEQRACAVAHRNLTAAEWSALVGPGRPRPRLCPDFPDD